jgi:group I intron endonuclease
MKKGLIYKISNSINKKLYIGLTTRPLEERILEYEYASQNSKTYKGIVAAMSKYGFDKFKFEIVEEEIPDEELDDKEIYYIEKYKSLTPNGYNISKGGRKDIGAIAKGNSKPVYQINPYSLEIISQENSIIEMARKLDAQPQHISAICNMKEGHFTAKDYTFAFVKTFDIRKLEKHMAKRQKDTIYLDGVEVYDMKTKEIIGTYMTAYKAAADLGINGSNLYSFLRGDRKTAARYNGRIIGIRYTHNPRLNAIAMLRRLDIIDYTGDFKEIDLNDKEKELQVVWNYIKLWEAIEGKE